VKKTVLRVKTTRSIKKLRLRKERIRALNPIELQVVEGGTCDTGSHATQGGGRGGERPPTTCTA
jgi:hypothetical protein